MYSAIIVTAALISIDALFVGMSLGSQKNFRHICFFVIAAIIFVICLSAALAASALRDYITFDTSLLVGGAFILLGVLSLFSKEEKKPERLAFGSLVVLGLVMSVDCAVGAAALTIDHSFHILTPVAITVGHLLYLPIGSFVTRFVKTSGKLKI